MHVSLAWALACVISQGACKHHSPAHAKSVVSCLDGASKSSAVQCMLEGQLTTYITYQYAILKPARLICVGGALSHIQAIAMLTPCANTKHRSVMHCSNWDFGGSTCTLYVNARAYYPAAGYSAGSVGEQRRTGH